MESCIRSGLPFPSVIENAPEIKDGLIYIFDIWEELSFDRQFGMGAGPIPSKSIRAYLIDHEIDLGGEDATDIRHCVREMDAAWLRWAMKKSENEKIKQKNPVGKK